MIFQDELEVLHQKNKSKLAIRTVDNVRAMQLLRKEGIKVAIDEEYMLIPCDKDEEVRRVSQLLYEQQFTPLRMEERKKSLEDIFLELTGKTVNL